eukprot:112968-Chlamydomonas_euryale.AAC.2
MQSGGYTAEITAPAVLRPAAPRDGDGGGAASADACTHTAYEWYEPTLTGDDPQERGYHAACASMDGYKVYVFGGIRRRSCCNTLAIIDVETWKVRQDVWSEEALNGVGRGLLAREWSGATIGEEVWQVWWAVGGGGGRVRARLRALSRRRACEGTPEGTSEEEGVCGHARGHSRGGGGCLRARPRALPVRRIVPMWKCRCGSIRI